MKPIIIIALLFILAGCAWLFEPYITETECGELGGAWVEMDAGHYSGATLPGCKL